MEIKAFFHDESSTLTYVVWDADTKDAVVIDPVLDLDLQTWSVSTEAVDEVAAFVKSKALNLHWILDTHVHADHLTGMKVLKEKFGAPTAISEHITLVQDLFAGVYNMKGFDADGSQFDRLLSDGEVVRAGALEIEIIATPGHTPACTSFKIGDAVFAGDTMFMPDFGTGRCDFPKGSAEDLYDSITRKLYTLPDATRVFVGHDYAPGGRELAWETSVGESKERNIQLRHNTTREEFVKFRSERDATLKPPTYILPSLQVNIAAGDLPDAEDNGRSYFKMPVNLLGG